MEAGEEDPEPEAAIQDADGAHENDERLKSYCNPFSIGLRWRTNSGILVQVSLH